MTEDAQIAALAAEQFHRHGITATGVDALSRAAGISKRTLYQRFGSKDGLIVAAYDALDLPVFQMLTEDIAADPRLQLEGFFDRLVTLVRSPEFRGCPFTNAAAELADPAHPAHAVVRRHKARIKRWFLSRARLAGARQPERLASRLMLLLAGVQAQSLVDGADRPAREARALAGELIAAAID